MKLYHGTNGRWLANILKRGIEPRRNHPARNNWKHVQHQSNSKCVYLTDSYAPYFAFNAARGTHSFCAVIEIDTDLLNEDCLYPDEDFLEQVGRNLKDGVPGDLSQRTLHYRAHQFGGHGISTGDVKMDVKIDWHHSLSFLGTCAHRGAIAPGAITRAAVWPHDQNIWMCFVWDPTITIINQQICGDRYLALTAKLFGNAPSSLLNEFDRSAVDAFDAAKISDLEVFSYPAKNPLQSAQTREERDPDLDSGARPSAYAASKEMDSSAK